MNRRQVLKIVRLPDHRLWTKAMQDILKRPMDVKASRSVRVCIRRTRYCFPAIYRPGRS